MSEKTILNTKFVITNIFNGKRQYYAIDSHSGGYPYWSDYIGSAKEFKDLNNIPTSYDDYMQDKAATIEILQIDEVATIISTKDIISQAKQTAMIEIAKVEAELRKKVAALEKLS